MSNFLEQSVFTANVLSLPRHAIGWVQRFNESMQALVNRTKYLKDALDGMSLFKGVYTSDVALNVAHPVATAGSYALVDAGEGNDAIFYWFDLDDGWVTNGDGATLGSTDALVEGITNKYFTNARAIAAFDSLTNIQKSQFLTNIGGKRSTNLMNKTASYALALSDFKDDVDVYDLVYLRVNSASATNITIGTALSSLPSLAKIEVRNVGSGLPTLVADDTTLNGNLAFTAQHEVKSIVKVGLNEWDVVGVLP